MYIQFQSVVNIMGLGAFHLNEADGKEAFFQSLSDGKEFFAYAGATPIRLDILSAKKIQRSNGYMSFTATATFLPITHNIQQLGDKNLETEVEGIISFNV